MMMNYNENQNHLILGYDLDCWNTFHEKKPISIDLSPKTNSHILFCGMSGSGKSYLENAIFAKLAIMEPHGTIFFADYKGDDSFSYLLDCPRHYFYTNTLSALDIVHNRLLARQSGQDSSRNPITLIWDEYMAQVLSLMYTDKKLASIVMSKVSEILLLGRSLSVRLIMSMQRPDAVAFPAGSRLNYGVVVILGAAVKSIYEMLLPDFREEIKGRKFNRGEGVVLLQGSELHFIKVPIVLNEKRMRQICINALDDSCRPSSEA